MKELFIKVKGEGPIRSSDLQAHLGVSSSQPPRPEEKELPGITKPDEAPGVWGLAPMDS